MVLVNLPRSSPLIDGRQSERALAICRGTRRMLATLNMTTLTELSLADGRRADIVALSPSGDIWIVEIKSSIEDLRADQKWPDYLDWCDRFLFAVNTEFPVDILPPDTGLIVADGYGAELIRPAPEARLAGARRKAVTLRFAHAAADRLHTLWDPERGPGVA
ncbi:MAG: MmcB family DNA repair protein [Hyphomicrobiaceae bacterium]